MNGSSFALRQRVEVRSYARFCQIYRHVQRDWGSTPEAKLRRYRGGAAEARLGYPLFRRSRLLHRAEEPGIVKPRLDDAAFVEPKLCLRLAPSPPPSGLLFPHRPSIEIQAALNRIFLEAYVKRM